MRRLNLDTALLTISAFDNWDIRHSLMHMLVLGTTGSGKSSATMKYIALAMLKAGYGMLFHTTKPEDAAAIKALCQQAGRMNSVIEVTPDYGSFNFLAWALVLAGGDINSVTDLLDQVLDIVRTTGPGQGKLGEEFWSSSKTAMLRATIVVIFAATGTVRIEDVLAFIRSAPATVDQMKDPEWQKTSAFFHFFHLAAQRLEAGPIPGFDNTVAARAMGYWREMAALDAKTLGNIKVTVTTALGRFQQGLLQKMFCGGTSVVPELLFHNAVIILNVPVQTYGDDAQIAQKIWKLCVQKACLSRNGLDTRQLQTPIGIIADEAHNFLYRDAEFLAQCRSSLVSVVFATQSIPAIRNMVGGDNPHDRAEHLISNFNTVVLHSSACPVTNDWFSRKIGRSLQRRNNVSEGHGTNSNYGFSMNEGRNWGSSSQNGGSYTSGGNGSGSSGSNWSHGTSNGGSDGYGKTKGFGTSHNVSQGYAEQMDFTYDPGEFGRMLKTGGPAFNNRVSAVWFQSGRQFASSGSNATIVEYRQ